MSFSGTDNPVMDLGSSHPARASIAQVDAACSFTFGSGAYLVSLVAASAHADGHVGARFGTKYSPASCSSGMFCPSGSMM